MRFFVKAVAGMKVRWPAGWLQLQITDIYSPCTKTVRLCFRISEGQISFLGFAFLHFCKNTIYALLIETLLPVLLASCNQPHPSFFINLSILGRRTTNEFPS